MRVAAIIPAYNEETRLPAVLRAVTASPVLDEVRVVSDGSTDATHEVAAATPFVGSHANPGAHYISSVGSRRTQSVYAGVRSIRTTGTEDRLHGERQDQG